MLQIQSSFWQNLSTTNVIIFTAPFVILLLLVASLPLAAGRWWESNKNKAMLCLTLGVPVALFFAINDTHKLLHTFLEYFAFISLLGALYVISGGIYLTGKFDGTPTTNSAILAIGAILSNFIGTTGSAMLFIRPIIRANQRRKHKIHTIIFFIFLVCNIGGSLTPLADPPLFLGFLKGVPFDWTLKLFPVWLSLVAALLVIYFLIDSRLFHKEKKVTQETLVVSALDDPYNWSIKGKINIGLLFCVILIMAASGYLLYPNIDVKNRDTTCALFQAISMILVAVLSYKITPKIIHKNNDFTFHPIIEVAVIFAGIFATMIPPLLILEARARDLGINSASQYFWATGILSSFLDNAPTYLTFTSLASGLCNTSTDQLSQLAFHETGRHLLFAISTGAVFMGANTYIGNGPNFMVKSIAEKSGIKMPSFFGYMLWSCTVLIPIFIILTFVYFK